MPSVGGGDGGLAPGGGGEERPTAPSRLTTGERAEEAGLPGTGHSHDRILWPVAFALSRSASPFRRRTRAANEKSLLLRPSSAARGSLVPRV